MKAITRIKTVLIAVTFLLFGILIGRHFTITSAELTHVTSIGYEITYGESTHYYEY